MKAIAGPTPDSRRDAAPFRTRRRAVRAPACRADCLAQLDRLKMPLSKYVFGFVRDGHTTEDLVQETYLRAIRSLDRYQGQAALKTWIYSIARNLCLDHLRASGRTRLRLLEKVDSAPGDRGVPDSLRSDPVREAERDESRAEVAQALAGLPRGPRMLIILRAYLGLSHREIAKQCPGAPAGLGSRIARALRILSTRLIRPAR